MIKELEKGEISNILAERDDLQLKMVLSSLIEGNTEGRIWALHSENKENYFLWDKGNIVFYLWGGRPSRVFLEDISELFQDEIRPTAEKENLSHFKFHNLTDISEGKAKSIFAQGKFREMDRYLYEYSQEEIETYDSSYEDIQIVDIDKRFLKNTDNRNLAFVLNEIKWMWPSFERYYKDGFGKAALSADEILCWCTAEYVSEDTCGVGIETLERYRHRGIGNETAAEFVNYCLKNDITPYWECDASNEPSVRLAEKLGFDRISEKKVWLGKF